MPEISSALGVAPIISGTEPGAIAKAASVLRQGGILAIPTDTVYGYAAAIDQERAIARLYALKGRPRLKAIPVLLSGPERIFLVARSLSQAERALAQRFWPGPLTIVLEALDLLPRSLTSAGANGSRTVAVRVPDHALARAIIDAAGGALAVTSANRSGHAPAVARTKSLASYLTLPTRLLTVDWLLVGAPRRSFT
jgi:L-threonylcarbamoyladenylate synthase